MVNRQIILDFATAAHAGQKRKDGKDYITHPIEVARITLEKWGKQKRFIWEPFTEGELYAVCLFHDILADTDKTGEDIIGACLQAGLDGVETHSVLEAVILLTRLSKEEDILEYLQPIKANQLAACVKLADLEHNMSDLKPGNLLDKYKLCKWYLEHGCRSGYHD